MHVCRDVKLGALRREDRRGLADHADAHARHAAAGLKTRGYEAGVKTRTGV
jgi:hypothetical protein